MSLYLAEDVSFVMYGVDYFKKGIPLVGKYKSYHIPFLHNTDNDGLALFTFDYAEFSEYSNYDLDNFLKKASAEFVGKIFKAAENDRGLEQVRDKKFIKEAKKVFRTDGEKEDSELVVTDDSDISKLYKDIKKTIISQDKQIIMILTSLFKNNRVMKSSSSDDEIHELKEIYW